MSDHAYEVGTVLYICGIRDFRERPFIYRGRSSLGDGWHVFETRSGNCVDAKTEHLKSLTDDVAFAAAKSIESSMSYRGMRWREFVTDEDYALAIKHYPEILV